MISEQIADLESWNAPPEVIAQVKPNDLALYSKNWDAISFFVRVQTQWTVSGMGQRIGFNYPGLMAAAELLGVDFTPELFDQIQTMELAALKEMSKDG